MEKYMFLIVTVALAVSVYLLTYSIMAVGVTITLVIIAVYVSQIIEKPLLDISEWNLSVVPAGVNDLYKKGTLPKAPSGLKEVFFVSGNKYTYDEAPAVCAVYNADLATYEQVQEAFSRGAEWCGYGWTTGGMALFPTQEDTWKKLLQEVDDNKRTRCGRPGINGGYFDPAMKFGVNCYGTKPNCDNNKYPIPVSLESDAQKAAYNKFKEDSGKIRVSSFNRTGWSMWGML
jgi:hypothetical protein